MVTASKWKDVPATGPGDSRPTAEAIIKDEGAASKLKGKTIFLTGCSTGLGAEAAKALHATGADLYLTARDMNKGQKVVDEILAAKAGSGAVHLLHLELQSLKSVRSCAAEFLSKSSTLNILICNAGIMAVPLSRTQEGFESQLGTNHFAHFLLFQLLQPALLAGSTPSLASRVVAVASSGHQFSLIHDDLNYESREYEKWRAYGQSKLANVYMANEIERRFGKQGLHGLSLCPGGCLTELGRGLPKEEAEAVFSNPELSKKFKTAAQGAATIVYAAISKDLEGEGGIYLEHCSRAGPMQSKAPAIGFMVPGYASYAFDQDAAGKLWERSSQLVGA